MMQHDYAAIEELDLDPIKVKLMHEESGEGWSLEHASAVEKEYRRFLYLMKKYPEEQAAPLMDVDTFWHYHILDTLKYAVDCDKVFGYFLHHFPYVGLRGEEDEEAHHQMGERMRELYEETFGEDYIRVGATAWSARAPEREATTAWSARAPEGVKTAWSARAPEGVKTAWSARASEGMAAKTAWSARAPESLAAQTAWSARAPAGLKTAWSARAVATAWSASPSRQTQGAPTVAWSASPTRQAQGAPTVAWSASPSRQAQGTPTVAWSASPSRQAQGTPTVAWSASPSRQADAAPAVAWSGRATVDNFYTERPRLAPADTAA